MEQVYSCSRSPDILKISTRKRVHINQSSYTVDIQSTLARTPLNTDVIFLGDMSVRRGKAECKIEEGIIGRYGEKNEKRNLGGKLAIDFLQECKLTCINARKPSAVLPYTFQSRAKGYSLIDIITVS